MAVAAPQPRPRRRPRRAAHASAARPRATRRVAGGVVWIAIVAVLLAGVVALNVAVLRTNLRIDELGQQRDRLRADNAALESKLATRASTPRIELAAARDHGLRPAEPGQKTHVDLGG